jgi:hypothetical protein
MDLYFCYIYQTFGEAILALLESKIATGYGTDNRGVGVRIPVRSRIFSSRRHPDRLWGLPGLLSDEYWGLFPRG